MLLTSKYHSFKGNELVIASQFRCTSKSVDLLGSLSAIFRHLWAMKIPTMQAKGGL